MKKVTFSVKFMNNKKIMKFFSTINPKEVSSSIMSETTYINNIYKNSLLSFGAMTLGASYLCTIPFNPTFAFVGMGMSLGGVIGFSFSKPEFQKITDIHGLTKYEAQNTPLRTGLYWTTILGSTLMITPLF